MMRGRWQDRYTAGRQLAQQLSDYRKRKDAVVLGLPRGGMPVAYEIAKALQLPLDVMVVRKIGAPGQPEFALGAIAPGGILVGNDMAAERLTSAAELASIIDDEQEELARREAAYRAGREPLDLQDKVVILVDDGLATGATMLAAIEAAQQMGAARTVVAAPVSSHEAAASCRNLADQTVFLATPEPFYAVGYWYSDFPQLSDAEVLDLLSAAAERPFQNPSRGAGS